MEDLRLPGACWGPAPLGSFLASLFCPLEDGTEAVGASLGLPSSGLTPTKTEGDSWIHRQRERPDGGKMMTSRGPAPTQTWHEMVIGSRLGRTHTIADNSFAKLQTSKTHYADPILKIAGWLYGTGPMYIDDVFCNMAIKIHNLASASSQSHHKIYVPSNIRGRFHCDPAETGFEASSYVSTNQSITSPIDDKKPRK